ncbi:MAG: glycosyltransferase family 2 protein [Acidobacteriota bacterium]
MPEWSTVSSSKVPRYSVVIPVFNSADIVETTIRQTIAFFERHGWSCEIIAVNDGSTDRSWDVLCETACTTTCVTAIDLASNHGQHAATLFGLARTTGDFVVTLDDDLQQPPDQIVRLVEQAEEGHDLVCGRFRQTGTPVRWLGSRTVGLLDRWLFDKPPGFVFTSFRLMRREVVDRLCAYRLRDPYLRGLLVRCASRPANVWVEHRPRPVGRSGYGANKIARFGMTMARTYLELRRSALPSPPPIIEIREVVGQ